MEWRRFVTYLSNDPRISSTKLRSKCHHRQTNAQFFTGQMPFLSPVQQCQSTDTEMIPVHFVGNRIGWRTVALGDLTSCSPLIYQYVKLDFSGAREQIFRMPFQAPRHSRGCCKGEEWKFPSNSATDFSFHFTLEVCFHCTGGFVLTCNFSR